MAILHDLEQIATHLVGERCQAEVVDDEEIGLGDLAQQRALVLQRRVTCEFIDEPRDAEEPHAEVRATRGMAPEYQMTE